MCDHSRRGFVRWSAQALALGGLMAAAPALAQEPQPAAPGERKMWACPPCGCPADGKEFPEPGACPACAMPMIEVNPKGQAPKPGAPEPKPAPAPAPQ